MANIIGKPPIPPVGSLKSTIGKGKAAPSKSYPDSAYTGNNQNSQGYGMETPKNRSKIRSTTGQMADGTIVIQDRRGQGDKVAKALRSALAAQKLKGQKGTV